MARTAVGLSLGMLLGGCGHAISPARAPATIAVQGEAGGGFTTKNVALAATAGLEASFEGQGCCGFGLYVTRVTIDNKTVARTASKDPPPVDDITEGGLEFTVVPIDRYFRVRVRAGLAGEPPRLPQLGRVGYAGGVTLLFRIPGPEGPAISKAVPHVDLFGGYTGWGFGRERTPAGYDRGPYNTGAFLFGVRISGDYGVDFQ